MDHRAKVLIYIVTLFVLSFPQIGFGEAQDFTKYPPFGGPWPEPGVRPRR